MSGEIPTPPPYPPRADDAACATRSRAEEAALRVRTAFYGSTASGEDVELVERVSYFMDEDPRYVRRIEQFFLLYCATFGEPSERRQDELECKEYPLEYQIVHQRYIKLVEVLLVELLDSFGVTPEAFVEVICRCGALQNGKRGHSLLRSINATHDFDGFLALMHDAKLMGNGCFAS